MVPRIDVLTLFPELVEAVCDSSIIGRALAAGHFELRTHQIRDFADNDYGKVDDTLYGGGTGMLMSCQPIYDCLRAVLAGRAISACGSDPNVPSDDPGSPSDEAGGTTPRLIYMSPKGRVLDQEYIAELAAARHLLILCGHYEGIDERIIEFAGFEEVSIGDYVLTGGELPACVLIDAVARQWPGVLSDSAAWREESHFSGMLEAKQYTKPQEWQGLTVPEVLLSGHHAQIDRWRCLSGLSETLHKRPDLFVRLNLSRKDYAALAEFEREHSESEQQTSKSEQRV